MTEYTQSPQFEKDQSTRFDSGDQVNFRAAQERIDPYQVGHDRAVTAELARQAQASMERPLKKHEKIAIVSQHLEDFRLWEAELAEQWSQARPDDYDLINS